MKRKVLSHAAKCLVLVPVHEHIEPGCEDGLRELERRGYTVWRRYGMSDIAFGRSGLASEGLSSGFEELMWIDSDILFNPDDLEKLRRHKLPIVGGIYAKKGDRDMACVAHRGCPEIVFGDAGGPIELKYIGAGFLLTRRVVYERIDRDLFSRDHPKRARGATRMAPFFFNTIEGRRPGRQYLSEDYSFCAYARKCGFKIMADTTVRLGHIGRYVYSWEELGGARERRSIVRVRVVPNVGKPVQLVLPPNVAARAKVLNQRGHHVGGGLLGR
ncbi:MAG TPA: hypothetical protein VG146_11835 [Verrucomicrobiae bacterium]|nr:hypothetical protein [Verrucomicrobiae bacterium]